MISELSKEQWEKVPQYLQKWLDGRTPSGDWQIVAVAKFFKLKPEILLYGVEVDPYVK